MTVARVLPIVLSFLATACAVGGSIRPTATPSQIDIATLWTDPESDAAPRELFYGAGGEARAPAEGSMFTLLHEDGGGYSTGYDVRGPDGMEWSVKLGPESQTEVVASRLLWALGYYQPATYYLSNWTMEGREVREQQPARFRPKLSDWKVEGEWSWYENDFVATQPFKGLIVANLILTNWDWKTSNNRIYAIGGSEGKPARRIFVVQDLGASLGKMSYPRLLAWMPTKYVKQGSRNNLEDFESQAFIERVDGDRVEFVYQGIHKSLLDTVSRADVAWIAQRMSRLTDKQWSDAFRAGGYADEHAARYISKIKSKIAEGLELAGQSL